MSFFSSLQQYVTSGVAGFGLSSRAFSRQESTEQDKSNTTGLGSNINIESTVGSLNSNATTGLHLHGFPKVVPPPGTSTTHTTRRQSSRSLECAPPVRTGSFRQRNSPVHLHTPDRPTLAFCKRRLSWPEVDARSTSGVQETDSSYFESFTALAWKRENRRISAVRAAETRAETVPENESEKPIEDMTDDERDVLYVEVLNTIANTIGAPVPGAQYAHYKDEMYLYSQRAFAVPEDKHYRLLNSTADDKPKIVVLTIVVQEAEGLEAKDAHGFSDPYCMLGIMQNNSISSQPQTPRTLSSDSGIDNKSNSPNHREHSFRLRFKQKDSRREQSNLLGGPISSKFIHVTSVKTHTLCPKWNEKFKFDIDDIDTDVFHLDIWDHDNESCVLDDASRLNEIRGVRGLSRCFKQVCQSKRLGSQDDFLGACNIPLADIPHTGIEGWFKLEGRTQRSTVQGRIQLKLWLSTRDINGTNEEDMIERIKKIECLQRIFILHELSNYEPSWSWKGVLPGSAITILHQMAVQGDLSDLQCAMARFIAAVKVNRTTPIDPKFIHRMLVDVDKLWNQPTHEGMNRELEQWLAEAMTCFVEKSLNQIRRHREIFPALHPPSLVRLEFLLRCLGLLGSMKAFRQVCPFNKSVRGEIVGALRKGSKQWTQQYLRESQWSQNPLVNFITILVADLQMGLTYYHSSFDNTNGIQYFSIIYKQFDAILAEEVSSRMETTQIGSGTETSISQLDALEHDKEPVDVSPFELYLSLQEFSSCKQYLSCMPKPPEKPLALQNYHEWFYPVVERWLIISKMKALQRVRSAIQLDQICEGNRIVRHSTSSIDVASCFYQMKEFWKMLQWPDANSEPHFEAQLIDVACSTAMHYSDLIHQALADSGYYEQQGPFRTSDDMCVTVNNLDYIRRALSEFRPDGILLHDNAENLLESSLTQLEMRAELVLSKLGQLMQVPLRKVVFHLAWSPDSLPANQAIVPLLEYLDVHLSALNSGLLTKNFNRALHLIWTTVLNELTRQMDTGGDGDRPSNFHDRLYEALQQLVEFFNAGGLGLAMESLHSEQYWHVEQRLQYHKTDTEKLIDLFYMQRLQDQLVATMSGPYGILAVRAYFNHDSLCVEVLHAKDIIPLDPNGFSDPFVIIELLPRTVFHRCNEQQTNVHKKTLNPIFDECFEFSVSLEQCLVEGAMIAFTVMDHDVLTANDFAGEAFLALGTIPGVANYNTSVENFHGLKQVDLPLMQQHDKNHPVLQTLESRTTDKLAQDFVKKQKGRLAV